MGMKFRVEFKKISHIVTNIIKKGDCRVCNAIKLLSQGGRHYVEIRKRGGIIWRFSSINVDY